MIKKIKTISFLLSSFLLFPFSFLPIKTFAQTGDLPPEIFGEYAGDAHITSTLLGIDWPVQGVSVELKNTNSENDYILIVPGLGFFDIPVLDNIIITPIEEGYMLSRTNPIAFIIPEIVVPSIPPYFPEGGTFYDVPVEITLENTNIVAFVLNLNIKIVATLTYYLGPIPIPIPVTINLQFEGMLVSSPPMITTTDLPGGRVGEAYYTVLEAEGISPLIWSITEGTLPSGLILDELTGTISGTPTEADTLYFSITVTNLWGSHAKPLSIEIEDTVTNGICTTDMVQFKLFPNPTTGTLHVISNELQVTSVEVFDIYGRKLKSKIVNLKSETVLDISRLVSGIYLLRIQTEKGAQIQKIIKQ